MSLRARVLLSLTLLLGVVAALWLWLSGGPSTARHTVMTPPWPAPLPSTPTAPATPPRPVEVPPPPLGVVLAGVVTGGDGQRMALVSLDRGPQAVLRVGDALTRDAVVRRIDEQSITYHRLGVDVRVPLQAPAATAQALAAPLPVRATPPAVDAPAPARGPDGEPGRGNAAFRDAVARKRQAIATGG